MPLSKGKSSKAMGANYKKLRAEGKPKRQAVAIMLNVAGKSNKGKKGGRKKKGK